MTVVTRRGQAFVTEYELKRTTENFNLLGLDPEATDYSNDLITNKLLEFWGNLIGNPQTTIQLDDARAPGISQKPKSYVVRAEAIEYINIDVYGTVGL